jgi:hypothetical protein
MVGTAVLDVAGGSAGSVSEAHHVLDLAGVVCLWVVARAERPMRWSSGRAATA